MIRFLLALTLTAATLAAVLLYGVLAENTYTDYQDGEST